MDFCSIYFGKPIYELSYQDIEDYFLLEQIETNQIEFKSLNEAGELDAKIKPLAENITSFLNSEGGVIIWGAPIGSKKENQKEKTFQGALTPINQFIEKDRFINKVTSLITPLPNSIKIQPLSKDKKFIYIIEIDQSLYSPHQTNDKYFLRIDGQKRVAPHHYIEALFKKIKYPNLEGFIKINHINDRPRINFNNTIGHFIEINFSYYIFNWSPFQNELDLNLRILLEEGIFQNKFNTPNLHYTSNGSEFNGKVRSILSYGEPYEHTEIIFYHIDENTNLKNNTLLFTFGGKYSPLKFCAYELDLKSYLDSNNDSICSVKYRNRFFKDLQDENNIDQFNIIRKLNLI